MSWTFTILEERLRLVVENKTGTIRLSLEFRGQGLRRLAWINAHLFHPREQGSPLKSQPGCGAIRPAHASLGLPEDSHNSILFIEVSGFRRSQVRAAVYQFGY